jgi:hypothetical protein
MRALIVTTLAVLGACGEGAFDADLDWGPGYILPVASLADDPSGTWVICQDFTCRDIDGLAFALEPGGHMRTPRARLDRGRLSFCQSDDDLWHWEAFGTQLTFTVDPRAPDIRYRERLESTIYVDLVQAGAAVYWAIRREENFEDQPVPVFAAGTTGGALSAVARVFDPHVRALRVRAVRVRSGPLGRCEVF